MRVTIPRIEDIGDVDWFFPEPMDHVLRTSLVHLSLVIHLDNPVPTHLIPESRLYQKGKENQEGSPTKAIPEALSWAARDLCILKEGEWREIRMGVEEQDPAKIYLTFTRKALVGDEEFVMERPTIFLNELANELNRMLKEATEVPPLQIYSQFRYTPQGFVCKCGEVAGRSGPYVRCTACNRFEDAS